MMTSVFHPLLGGGTHLGRQHKLYHQQPIRSADGRRCRCSLLLQPAKQAVVSRRHGLVCSGTSLITVFISPPAWGGGEDESVKEEENDNGIVGAIKSLLDPNEQTKSGKILPKAYLKSAREVVKTLRESLKEDSNDIAKFRRTADSAKESIRDYLSNWRGKESVAKEESYAKLEKVVRSLAKFYSKAGPSAALPEDVKSSILNDLDAAEQFL